MANLTFSQLEGYWIQAGGNSAMAPLMAAIALAESSGDPNSTNPTDNNGTQTSWGLWQISNGDHSEPAPNWNDPLENARLAVAKFHSQGLGAWGTYTSGAYKQYMSGAAPVTPTGAGAAGGTTADAGFSLSGALGWLDPLGATSGISSVVGAVFGPIANAVKSFYNALNTVMGAVIWIINPANWVRIFAGIAGTVALILGMYFVVKAS